MQNLRCPECNYDCNHVQEVLMEAGDAVLTVEGECGHWWEIHYRQKKGQTLVTTKLLPSSHEVNTVIKALEPLTTNKKMTAKAGGNSYDAFKNKGWTDEQLLAHGYMQELWVLEDSQ